MEQIRNIGQLCRQHYEKLILTAGLLILAGAVWFLYTASGAERDKIKEIPAGFKDRKVKGVQPVNMAGFSLALKQVEAPPVLDFSKDHLLFNPVAWQTRSGGEAQKIKSNDQIGPGAMTATSIEPFHLWVVYGSASLSGDQKVIGYYMFSTNEFLPRNARYHKIQSFMGDTGTNNSPREALFFLREIKGEPKEPTEILAEMKEDKERFAFAPELPGEKFSFAPGKPYTRVIGYEADLLYKPSGRKYTNLRKGAPIDIDGQNYKIVDILPNQVVLSDDSNGKQYSITRVPQ